MDVSVLVVLPHPSRFRGADHARHPHNLAAREPVPVSAAWRWAAAVIVLPTVAAVGIAIAWVCWRIMVRLGWVK